MFRCNGHTQIITTKKKLHFSATPLKGDSFNAPILVRHLGHITKERRLRKYDFYQQEDTHDDQSDYEYLLDGSSVLKNIYEISL